jgi:hypothetical protein
MAPPVRLVRYCWRLPRSLDAAGCVIWPVLTSGYEAAVSARAAWLTSAAGCGWAADLRPEAGLAAVSGPKAGEKGVVRLELEAAVIADEGRQGAAFGEVAGCMAVALRLGAIECVLDHGAAQQRRRERMAAL